MELDLEAILQTYLAECAEHFAKMEEALVALEANPDDDKLLEAIFRGAHTLKGNSASLGYPKVAAFAHGFEEMLQRFRNHALPVTQERITLLLRSLDAMRQMVPEAIAGADELQTHHVELLHQLASGNADDRADARNAQAAASSRRPFGRRQADATAWMERAGTIRVDTQKLDRMLNLAGEIAIAQGRLHQAIDQSASDKSEVLEAQNQVQRLS